MPWNALLEVQPSFYQISMSVGSSATVFTLVDDFDRLTGMRSRTYIFAVGVEEYQSASFPTVVYAEQDAEGFVRAWQEMGVDAVDTVTLDREVSQDGFRSRFSDLLSRVSPADRLFVFYSGHGASFHGASVLTVFDTQVANPVASSIQLTDILNEIRQVQCSQVLLFLDASHSPLIPDSEFSCDELRSFCKESDSRFAFVSCKPKEVSHSSRTLDHGIWTHCLLQAIRGSAKDAIGKDNRVTTTSLQTYLLAEVPRILRVTVAGAVKQTPVTFGNKAKEMVVVDLVDAMQNRQLAVAESTNPIKDSCLTGESRGRVRELRGYSKPRTQLTSHNDWERDFVEQAGAAEVTAHATDIFEQLRESFRYKRKDLSFTNIASTASIKGPDFDVNISLYQDPDDAEKYLLSTEVRSIRNPAVIDDPNFLAIFTKYCKRIVFELDSNLDIESKIDDIEEIEAMAKHLDYDPECTEFTLRLPNPGIVIHATVDRIVFALDSQGDLKLLLGNAQKAFAQLAGNHINLGLRRTSR